MAITSSTSTSCKMHGIIVRNEPIIADTTVWSMKRTFMKAIPPWHKTSGVAIVSIHVPSPYQMESGLNILRSIMKGIQLRKSQGTTQAIKPVMILMALPGRLISQGVLDCRSQPGSQILLDHQTLQNSSSDSPQSRVAGLA